MYIIYKGIYLIVNEKGFRLNRDGRYYDFDELDDLVKQVKEFILWLRAYYGYI